MKYLMFLFLMALCVIRCSNNITEMSSDFPDLSVICVLSTHLGFQQAYVYNTTTNTAERPYASELFNLDAQMTIRHQNLDISFQVQENDRGHPIYTDSPQELPIVHGHSYELTVTSGTTTIIGQTTMPGDFELMMPEEEETVPLSVDLVLSWTESNTAFGYLIEIRDPPEEIPVSPDSTVPYRERHNFMARDTFLVIPAGSFGETGEYLLRILAFDENYHYHKFEGLDISGIEGGYGLFGATVLKSRRFFME